MAVTLKKVLSELGESMVTDIKKQIKKDRSHLKEANSTLLRSLTYSLDGNQLTIVAPEAPYEFIVDKGRDPGAYVPVASIKKWISEKNIKAKDVAQDRLPYAIVNSIYNKGIDGINFSENTLNKFSPIIAQSIGIEYQKELERIMKEIKQITNM